jgi:hypothetical protein
VSKAGRPTSSRFPKFVSQNASFQASFVLIKFAASESRILRSALLEPCAGEHDVGADREPEGVIADKRYLDEHAKDRKDHQYQREHKPKVHCAYLLALRRNAKTLLD